MDLLLVEDDAATRRIAALSLTRLGGHRVSSAANGAEALRAALAGHFDAILLDSQMPEMDGWEALRRLKADARTKGVPVVMLSASDQESDRLRALALGAKAWIAKPFDPKTLPEQVARALAP